MWFVGWVRNRTFNQEIGVRWFCYTTNVVILKQTCYALPHFMTYLQCYNVGCSCQTWSKLQIMRLKYLKEIPVSQKLTFPPVLNGFFYQRLQNTGASNLLPH